MSSVESGSEKVWILRVTQNYFIILSMLSWALEYFCDPASMEGGSSSFVSLLFLLYNWALLILNHY